jgi:hypothetical protein
VVCGQVVHDLRVLPQMGRLACPEHLTGTETAIYDYCPTWEGLPGPNISRGQSPRPTCIAPDGRTCLPRTPHGDRDRDRDLRLFPQWGSLPGPNISRGQSPRSTPIATEGPKAPMGRAIVPTLESVRSYGCGQSRQRQKLLHRRWAARAWRSARELSRQERTREPDLRCVLSPLPGG